jgi:arylsulfatase A-like enzyme
VRTSAKAHLSLLHLLLLLLLLWSHQGGYDYMNRGEKTAGHIMAADGYKTAHFGKWHNGRTLGYEPWHFGFEDSWFPELYINLDNMMRFVT